MVEVLTVPVLTEEGNWSLEAAVVQKVSNSALSSQTTLFYGMENSMEKTSLPFSNYTLLNFFFLTFLANLLHLLFFRVFTIFWWGKFPFNKMSFQNLCTSLINPFRLHLFLSNPLHFFKRSKKVACEYKTLPILITVTHGQGRKLCINLILPGLFLFNSFEWWASHFPKLWETNSCSVHLHNWG